MKLTEYLNSIPAGDREEFARKVGHSFDYLRQIGYGNRSCSADIAVALDRESKRSVDMRELCPGVDWEYARKRLCKR